MLDAICPNRCRWFCLACLGESLLLAAAAVLGYLLRQPLLADFHWRWRDGALGCLAALPPLGFFVWALQSRWPSLVAIRQFLENRLRPAFSPWSLAELLLISLLAGLGEETLFRAVLHGGLAKWIGQPAAVLFASLAFGLCHLVNRAYALIVGCMGLYLSGLWLLTGNLLAPMTAHAAYDFAALVYFLRVARPR
jgi:hypothetical protein